MKIAKVESIPLKIPYQFGGRPTVGWALDTLSLSILMVRVETEEGLVGWGEAFSYNCLGSVQAMVDQTIAPLAVGRDARDITGVSRDLQQRLHLFGRYGVTLFGLSGLDIALWDIAAKAAGVSLATLFGGASRTEIPAYASLLKYAEPPLVGEKCRAALDEGYGAVKLHETGEAEVRAAREAMGDGVPLCVDTNCPWTPNEARQMVDAFRPYDVYWLEEPVFPPEDFESLAKLNLDMPIAAGENACTAFQFQHMIDVGAVTYAQPSVTKVGGITEFRKIESIAETAGVSVMPHSPYFGPGWLATLQLASASAIPNWVERFYCDMEASLYGEYIDVKGGRVVVPQGPGLGCEPNPDVIKEYWVRD
ncbi:MAG: mandelate racemase/muconate lactonizing enzyme family protein [Pseudomonadota bacterium]